VCMASQPSMSECVKVVFPPAPDALEPPGVASTGVGLSALASLTEWSADVRVASTHRCAPQYVALSRPVIRIRAL
jgi:hypothetical protein